MYSPAAVPQAEASAFGGLAAEVQGKGGASLSPSPALAVRTTSLSIAGDTRMLQERQCL